LGDWVLTSCNCSWLISVKFGANFICCNFRVYKVYKTFSQVWESNWM
jgi:hypothetical protein